MVYLDWPIGSKDTNWLGNRKVVEVHVHFPLTLGPGKEELHIALDDGTRRLLYRAENSWPTHRMSRLDILRLAENIAETCECSVRILRSLRAPTSEEIVVLAANRDRGFEIGQFVGRHHVAETIAINDKDKCVENDKFKPRMRVEVRVCQACGNPLAINVVECKRCSALFHNGCWERAGVCPMPNCAGRVADRPSAALKEYERNFVNFTFSSIIEPETESYSDVVVILVVVILCFKFFPIFLAFAVLLILGPVSVAVGIDSLSAHVVSTSVIFLDEDEQKIYERECTLPLKPERVICDAKDIIEVHHHWYINKMHVREELYILLRNGTRLQLMSMRGQGRGSAIATAPENQVDYIADKVARYAKCPIRFVRGPKPPPVPAGLLG